MSTLPGITSGSNTPPGFLVGTPSVNDHVGCRYTSRGSQRVANVGKSVGHPRVRNLDAGTQGVARRASEPLRKAPMTHATVQKCARQHIDFTVVKGHARGLSFGSRGPKVVMARLGTRGKIQNNNHQWHATAQGVSHAATKHLSLF